ncbi:Protein of unknown function [Leuconostoc citreum LBAE C10]
MALVD